MAKLLARTVVTLGFLTAAALAAAPFSLAQGWGPQLPPQPPQPPQLRRYLGPVQLGLASILVAPGKPDGNGWDPRRLVEAPIAKRIGRGLPPDLAPPLFRTLSHGGDPFAFLGETESWTLAAYSGDAGAPDIEVTIYVNGRFASRAEKVQDNFYPRWQPSFTTPVQLGPNSVVELRVVDKDVVDDDDMGSCVIRGVPWVDNRGYADVSSVQCSSQIWAVGLRVVPLDTPGAQYPGVYSR